MVSSSLGGYALTTKDGKIAYYQVSEGADSALPFNNNNMIDISDLITTEGSSGFIWSVYDVSGIAGYKNFTVDNFVFSMSGANLWANGISGTHKANPSYDANTGIFKIPFRYSGSVSAYTININKAYLIL